MSREPPGEEARVVFIGRIAPIKGLEDAVRALPGSTVQLDIYGPIEDRAYWDHCQSLGRSLSVHTRMTYRGVLGRDEVGAVLEAADALVIPTRGENFGHMIAEALACGCPPIVGENTPWSSAIAEGRAGWVVAPSSVSDVTNAFLELASMDAAAIRRMRAAAVSVLRNWLIEQASASSFESVAQRVVAEGLKAFRQGC